MGWGRITRTSGLGALALVACGGTDPVTLPNNPDAVSTLLLIEQDGDVSGQAFDGDGAGAVVTEDLDNMLLAHVLYYEAPLANFGLSAGPVRRALSGEPSRALPPFSRLKRLIVGGGATVGFETVFELSGEATTFRLPYLDARACLSGGGCFGDAGGTCVTPCPNASEVVPPTLPELPDPPAPPSFLPCLSGWVPDMRGDLEVCAPPARVACPAGEVQWLDAAACAPIAPCPSGEWPEGLPASGVLYVRPGASAGDGSLAAPFGTLAEALTAATVGATVALARGSHDGPITIDKPLSVVGACPAETAIASVDVAVTVTSTAASLRGLHLIGQLTLEAGAKLHAEGLWIESTLLGIEVHGQLELYDVLVGTAAEGGLRMNGSDAKSRVVNGVFLNLGRVGMRARGASTLWAEKIVIDGVVPADPDWPDDGRAVLSIEGSNVRLEQAWLANAAGGLNVEGRSRLTVREVVVSTVGDRLAASSGGDSDLVAARLRVEGSEAIALFFDRDGRGELSDVSTWDTLPRHNNQVDGIGLVAFAGSVASCERCRFEQSSHMGILIGGRGTVLNLSDGVVRDTRPRASDGALGTGVSIDDRALLNVTRVAVENSVYRGMEIFDDGNLVGSDLKISGTLPDMRSGERGAALQVVEGSTVALTRFAAFDNHHSGLQIGDVVNCTVDDLTVERTRWPTSRVIAPAGLRMGKGQITLRHVSLLDNDESGAVVEADGTDVHMEDVTIVGGSDSLLGLRVSQGALLTVERLAVRAPGPLGIDAQTSGQLKARDVSVSGARSTGDREGIGMSVAFGLVEFERFLISDNTGTGISFTDGDMLLSDGVIERQRIGLSVGQPDFNLERIARGVVFRDNDENIGR